MYLKISDINSAGRSFQTSPQDGKINFKNGEVIRATVVRNLPEGGVLLSANGKQLDVMTGMKYQEGSSHLFKVNLTGSRVELNLIEHPLGKTGQPAAITPSRALKETLTGAIAELKSALGRAGLSGTTGQSVQNLRQLMPLILYTNPKDHNGIWLKENIMAGGLFWESKVADLLLSDEKNITVKKLLKGDLKGALLSLRKGLLSEEGGGNEALMMKIKQALSLVEGNQELSLSALEDGLGWLFFIPGFEEDGFLGAKVFSKKRDEKGGIFFSVLLEFTKLGRFQANVAVIESRTSVRILMDNEEKARIVSDNLHLLEKGLSALGIINIAVSCDVRNGADAIEEMITNLKRRKQNISIVI